MAVYYHVDCLKPPDGWLPVHLDQLCMGPTLGNEYGRSLPLEDGQATATENLVVKLERVVLKICEATNSYTDRIETRWLQNIAPLPWGNLETGEVTASNIER